MEKTTPHSGSQARPRSVLAKGAEALLIRQDNKVIKRRIKKSYRLKEIDEKLRKQRTKKEAKLLEKLQGKICVPKILRVDEKNKEIIMEFIEGKKLSENLDNFPLEKQLEICRTMGEEIGKMHNEDIIHGDLTTANMILVEDSISKEEINKPKEQMSGAGTKIFFIDFGLSFHSKRIEDKAVDLHLLKQALESKHFSNWENLFKAVISTYETKDKEKILKQLEKVEKRGRYKH